MRITKFRGKSIDNGQWYYGHYYEVPSPLQCIGEQDPPKCYIVFENPNSCPDWNMPRQMVQVEVKRDTVGEYIGLKDIDDKEIYEGDLFYYHNVLRKVVYREDNTSWMGVVVGDNSGSCNFYLRDITNDYDLKLNAKIIGNEFE